jgi:cellulose biosynthesis protein BcsQ
VSGPFVHLDLSLLFHTPLAVNPPTPTWTDKEVLVAIGSVVGALIPVILFLIRLATRWSRKRLKKAEAENQRLRMELDALQKAGASSRTDLTTVEKQLWAAQQNAAQLMADNAATKNLAEDQRRVVEQLNTTLGSLQESVREHQGDLAAERRRVQRALQKDGRTWAEKVLSSAREFRPLEPDGRRTPVLSVLNLKGGVGKTTITANLGAALDQLGYRVLLVDLDLQGSLTGLFLPEAEQERLAKEGRMLEDFLAASFGSEFPNLLDYIQPVLSGGGSGLVPTADSLAYAETNLTIRWLLRECNRDPRFLLRRDLQLKRVTNDHDIILLDCPPLINVCCVNALAASDYVLVPIMPSKQATDRVPVLLKRLREFRENINPDLKVMGVVPNRTQRSELTADEHNRLSLLRDQCKDIWGQEVPQLETFIRQSAELRAAEDEHRPLSPAGGMFGVFIELAREVESHVPMFCRHLSRHGKTAEAML